MNDQAGFVNESFVHKSSGPDLVIEDLTVEFDAGGYAVRPLDRFTETVSDGALAVILGPSGCGKTTLLSCLGGILTPNSGTIRYGDITVTGMTQAELTSYRQHNVGIVFQAFNLVASLDATGNVMAPLRAAGMGRRAARERAEYLLHDKVLGDRMHHHPAQLSGGQKQRVSLARALAHDPAIIIADEPTASLDYVQVEGVLRLLRELAAPGRVVVVATHDDRLLPLADEIVQMVPRFRDEGPDPITTELTAGEVLFEQGSRGNRIYLIEKGSVAVIRVDPRGRETVLATLGVGEHFGEMGPLFGIARSATVRAREATTVVGYTVEQFRDHVGVERLTDLVRPER